MPFRGGKKRGLVGSVVFCVPQPTSVAGDFAFSEPNSLHEFGVAVFELAVFESPEPDFSFKLCFPRCVAEVVDCAFPVAGVAPPSVGVFGSSSVSYEISVHFVD